MYHRGDLVGLPFLALCLAAFARHNGLPSVAAGPRGGLLQHQYAQPPQQPPLPPPLPDQQQQQPPPPRDALVREGDAFHLPLAALQHGLMDALAWNDAVAAGAAPPGTRPPPESLTRAGVSFFFGESNGTTFAALRGLYGLGNAEYLQSMASGFEVFASNSKSRQFFCFTGDRRFIIKTMSSEELRALSAVLGPYTQHLTEHPRSLLVHYCGHYHVRLYKYATDEWEDVHFLVMRNLMADPRAGLPVRELYDVKGSTVGRAASEKDKAKETKILKDLDLLERPRPLDFGADKHPFMDQVERDVAFLRAQGVMDYSLLLGVVPLPHHPPHQHHQQPPHGGPQRFGGFFPQRVLSYFLGPAPGTPQYYQQQFHRSHGGGCVAGAGGGWVVPHPRGQELYVAGIIDVLQLYNRRKQAETLLKSVVYKRDAISAVDPDLYASRFLGFVDRVVCQHAPPPLPPAPAGAPPLPPQPPQQWAPGLGQGPSPPGPPGWGRGGAGRAG